MWMSVDRLEGNIVVLIDDEERIIRLPIEAYTSFTDADPVEATMLWVTVDDKDRILTARIDETETARRAAAARARLDRLFRRA